MGRACRCACDRRPERTCFGETMSEDYRQTSLAEEMFNAYNEQGPNPWKTYDGKDVPRWDSLNDQVRAKWKAAADLAIDVIASAAVSFRVHKDFPSQFGEAGPGRGEVS